VSISVINIIATRDSANTSCYRIVYSLTRNLNSHLHRIIAHTGHNFSFQSSVQTGIKMSAVWSNVLPLVYNVRTCVPLRISRISTRRKHSQYYSKFFMTNEKPKKTSIMIYCDSKWSASLATMFFLLVRILLSVFWPFCTCCLIYFHFFFLKSRIASEIGSSLSI
jgi:hypothetical protein